MRSRNKRWTLWMMIAVSFSAAPWTASAGAGCGQGPNYLASLVDFGHEVTFTIPVAPGMGYLIDCVQHADAYLELYEHEGSTWTYEVWGQLGTYT